MDTAASRDVPEAYGNPRVACGACATAVGVLCFAHAGDSPPNRSRRAPTRDLPPHDADTSLGTRGRDAAAGARIDGGRPAAVAAPPLRRGAAPRDRAPH